MWCLKQFIFYWFQYPFMKPWECPLCKHKEKNPMRQDVQGTEYIVCLEGCGEWTKVDD